MSSNSFSVAEHIVYEKGSALHLTLSEVYVLWLERFGDKWVKAPDIEDDVFFEIAAERLHRAGLLERITVHGNGVYDVYRIRGDDANR